MTEDRPALPEGETARPPEKPRVRASAILAGSREAIIEHAGEEYRLRLTKNGKLILTK